MLPYYGQTQSPNVHVRRIPQNPNRKKNHELQDNPRLPGGATRPLFSSRDSSVLNDPAAGAVMNIVGFRELGSS